MSSKREIIFSNYRNVGFETEEKLLINTSIEDDKIGNLIILIGPNNSGKSNILDGIYNLNNQFNEIDERNITSLSFDEKFRNPSLRIKASENNSFIENSIDKERRFLRLSNEKIIKLKKEIKEAHSKVAKSIDNFSKRTFDILQYWIELENKLQNSNEYLEEIWSTFDNAIDNQNYYYSQPKQVVEKAKKELIILIPTIVFILDKINSNILYYEDEDYKIEQKTLNNFKINQIGNGFFKKIFDKIGYDVKTLNNSLEESLKYNVAAYLEEEEEHINAKLKDVSTDFNKIYLFGNNSYQFKIKINKDEISFLIFNNKKGLNLDDQSTGFKWFFNFYFSILSGNDLQSGDIILMDEPGIHIHPSGQKELRNFLKEFTTKTGITIILATHSPFFIDLDNLDEIRVINIKDNKVIINNKFHSIDENDNDVINKIKNSLTVNTNVLFDTDNKVVFVEGITDYNYLTAFKKYFRNKNNSELEGIDKIIFLPINGVGKTKEDAEELSKKILKIRKSNFIVLVDNDKAGNQLKEVNSKNSAVKVLSLGDIDNNFKSIESVFSENDRKKINIDFKKTNEPDKSFENSSSFKTHIEKYKIDKETINNFKKIFEKIIETIN